jgi:ribonuclease BN (tRNA processing enzyme)
MNQLKLTVLAFLCMNFTLNAERIYVNAIATGTNNGSSWENAYTDLQQAIDHVNPGDEIWVAQGMYYPTSGNDRNISFRLKENITLYGGFKGNETKLSQRNWDANETILSGNIGDKSTNTDNSMHVVVTANGAVLDGFIVEDGYALGGKGQPGMPQNMGMGKQQAERQGPGRVQGGPPNQGTGQPQTHTTPKSISESANNAGGGILNFKTCATVRNTIVRNCSAAKGGGVYNMTNTTVRPFDNLLSPVFINVKIYGNYAVGRGGGMQNDLGTHPVLINCVFTQNECSAKGGALYNDFSCSPIILNCLFENNRAHDAAAIGNDGSSCPVIIDTKIVNNTAESNGAGLYQGSYNANLRGTGNMPLVINSVIKDNKSVTNGMHNIINWGEDWIYAWNSEIDGFKHSPDKLDDNYSGLTEIAAKVRTLDAVTIDGLYLEKIKEYLNSNRPKEVSREENKGFGTGNILTKTADIPQNVWYVRNGISNGNGKSWENAFNNLNEAIEIVQKNGGGEIWVAAGMYKPTNGQNRNASFVMKNGVAIYGGFSGTENNKTERNPEANKTILSGNIGNEKIATDNSYHVVLGSLNSIIDGVTVSDGYADGVVTDRFGGGLYSWGYESSSIIKNSTFTNNYAEDGGAVFCFADVLSYFENVRFENNSASIGGAASFRFGSSCELDNCTFSNNTSTSRAGAVTVNYGSNVLISNTVFTKNKTNGNGGAIWVDDQASQYGGTKPVISQCVFSENSAAFYGGAIHNYNIATSVIKNCTFTGNSAQFGNDIANTLRCQVTISTTGNSKADIYTDVSSSVTNTSSQNAENGYVEAGEKEYKPSAPTPAPGNDRFYVTILGSGSPEYNPGRTQPSVLVHCNGLMFLVDMGNGTMTHLEKLGFTGRNAPDALFLTHHHIDHNAEFIPMVHAELLSGKEFLIAGPSPVDEITNYAKIFYKEDLNYRMSGRGKMFNENNTNETVMVLKGGERFDYKGVMISTLEVPHSIKTIAYRFEANGKSIVITGDLNYTDQLPKLAKDADILVIDGKAAPDNDGSGMVNQMGMPGQRPQNGSQQNTGNKSIPAHASLNEVAKMAAECNPKILVLTHLGNQPANEEATAKRYAEMGFKGKLIIASDLLSVTPDGETSGKEQKTTSNTTGLSKTQNLSTPDARAVNDRNINTGLPAGSQGDPISRFDANGDHKISESEAKGPLRDNFSEFDTNKDGFISSDELKKRR